MNKVFAMLIAGVFVSSVFATDSTSTVEKKADSDKIRALENIQNSIPDSVKARIASYKIEIAALKTEIETQREMYKAKIDSQKVEFRTAIKAYVATLPDSLQHIEHLNLPDSIKAKLILIRDLKDERQDSMKVLIDKRKSIAKEEIVKNLENVDSARKAKYEKTLAQLEKKLAERKMQAEKTKAKLEDKKEKIIEKIEKNKNK